MTALCRTRPADWWDVPSDSNRLALLICSVCPERTICSDGDPEPHGVIRGGVAWSGHGERLPICPCGRPAPNAERADCFTCVPRWDTRIPRVPPKRTKRRRGSALAQAGRITSMRSAGLTFREISERLDIPYSTLRDVVRRCPQAVSTEEDAA